MSNQSKVTDFFVAQKRGENTFRSVNKNSKCVNRLETNESIGEQTAQMVEKTPKRKKVVTKSVSKSSKRKKTPKSEVIIELKTNNEQKNRETIGSNAEEAIDVKTNEKQLNAIQVKEKLRKCNNLLELKKQLATINDCAAKVRHFKASVPPTPTKKVLRTPNKHNRSPANQSPIRSLTNTPMTPILPPLKSPVLTMTPNKDSNCASTYRRRLFDVFEDEAPSPPKALPKVVDSSSGGKESLRSYQRFAYLVRKPEDTNRSLVLPQKFKLLAEVFKSIDTIVSMFYKRQEVCTFGKLKDSVERMTNRKFDSKRLAQILTVFRNAFKVKYDIINSILDNRKASQQLVITPVYNSNVDIRMSSTHLLERYQLFVDKLIAITKQYHNKYLNGLGVNVEDKQLYRWHPKFKLDEVPDIEPNDNALPVEPTFGTTSAEHFLETSRQRFGIASTTESTEQTKDSIDSNDNTIDDKTTDTSNKKITKGLLKGISIDLLNKIRAKEAANLAQEMTRKPEVENEIRILRTLPEFVRIIHTFMIGSKKLAIPYDELIHKIISSFNTSLSILRAREHVDYLCRLLPDWIYALEVKKGVYIKINKLTSLSKLEDRIEQKIKHLKK